MHPGTELIPLFPYLRAGLLKRGGGGGAKHRTYFSDVWQADRISYCPLDRVLTCKNLIYLLNLQFYLSTNIETDMLF